MVLALLFPFLSSLLSVRFRMKNQDVPGASGVSLEAITGFPTLSDASLPCWFSQWKLTRLPLSLLHSTILISYLIKHFLFVHFLGSWRCCLKPHALPLSRIFQSYTYPDSPCPLLSKLSIDSSFIREPFPFDGVQVCRTFHAWYGKSLCGSFRL